MATPRQHLFLLFSLALALLLALFLASPTLSDADRAILHRLPRQGSDLHNMKLVIEKYQSQHSLYVHVAFCYLYVFLQSFAIPGPLVLSILAGALFGAVKGFLLVCLSASLGASCCYLLSLSLGRDLVLKSFPDKMALFRQKTKENRDNLFWYLLFLRVTPLLPNWFINLGSPLVDIPFPLFFFATALGIMPANFIHVRTGLFLHDLDKIGLNATSLLSLAALGCLALVPVLLKKKAKQGKLD